MLEKSIVVSFLSPLSGALRGFGNQRSLLFVIVSVTRLARLPKSGERVSGARLLLIVSVVRLKLSQNHDGRDPRSLTERSIDDTLNKPIDAGRLISLLLLRVSDESFVRLPIEFGSPES